MIRVQTPGESVRIINNRITYSGAEIALVVTLEGAGDDIENNLLVEGNVIDVTGHTATFCTEVYVTDISNVTIRGNNFLGDIAAVEDTVAVSVARLSSSDFVMRNIRIEDNFCEMASDRADHGLIEIWNSASTSGGNDLTLDGITISGNHVVHPLNATAETSIFIYIGSDGDIRHVDISNNVIEYDGVGYCIYLGFGGSATGSLSEISICENDILMDPSATNARAILILHNDVGASEGILINGNRIIDAEDYGIDIDAFSHAVVSNNYVKMATTASVGILIGGNSSVEGATIDGNTVEGCSNALQISIGKSSITGNTLRNFSGTGISLSGEGSTVSGNTLTASSAGYGIYTGYDYHVIASNNIRGTYSTAGILLDTNSDENFVHGNKTPSGTDSGTNNRVYANVVVNVWKAGPGF
jgi:hypothetical protein